MKKKMNSSNYSLVHVSLCKVNKFGFPSIINLCLYFFFSFKIQRRKLMENCLKLHFFEATFSVIWIRQKMGFNLIQRRTCSKISADGALHYWKMINCTKFRARKSQNFKIKSFEIVCEIIALFLTRPRSLQN